MTDEGAKSYSHIFLLGFKYYFQTFPLLPPPPCSATCSPSGSPFPLRWITWWQTRSRCYGQSCSSAPPPSRPARPPCCSRRSLKTRWVGTVIAVCASCTLYIHSDTVEPPNTGHLGSRASVLYSEVSFIRSVRYRRFHCTCFHVRIIVVYVRM